ncbi:MAG: hypothetical protein ACRELD_07735 [Longimicrobiales bacterium]
MLNSRSLLLIAAFAAVFAHGCSTLATQGPRQYDRATSTLAVHNTHWEDVAIYLDRGGTLIKIGTVGSMQTRSFELDPAQVGSGRELRLVVEPRVSRQRHESIVFSVAAGRQIGWTIRPQLRLSSLVIR